MGLIDAIKDRFFSNEEKVEVLDVNDVPTMEKPKKKASYSVRIYNIAEEDDYHIILRAIEKGNEVAIVNVRPIKENNMISAKVAVNKIKKKVDETKGDIVALNKDWLVAMGGFAHIQKKAAASQTDVTDTE